MTRSKSNSRNLIRVVIADRHRVVTEALRSLIAMEPDMEVAGCAREAGETIDLVRGTMPDVLVMEHRLAELNGIETAARIHHNNPTVRVLMLSTESAAQHILRALEAGAAGYVPKDASGADLVHAIRVVHEGHRYVHASLAGDVLQALMHPVNASKRLSALSSRELQVMQMMVEGRSNGQIAGALYLSPKTISTYKNRVMEKLELPDLPAVVRFAIQHGIGPQPERFAAA